MRVAVFDLGSTTFQLLVADGSRDGSLTPILRDRVVLNLGMAVVDGRIPSPVAARAAEVVRRFRRVAERLGSDRVVAVATSALREAANRRELRAVLEPAAGVPLRFIDGVEEARLMFIGIRTSVALGPGRTLFLDLGGGSLEVAVADETLLWGESLPLGAGRLTAELIAHDPPTQAEQRALGRRARAALAPLAERVRQARIVRAVASGGTAGAMARILAAQRWRTPPESLNGFALRVRELQDLAGRLSRVPLAARLKIPGIDERRAEILPTGAIVLASAGSLFGVRELIHSEWGLREGIVLDELGLGGAGSLDPAELRRRSVEALARRWSEDPEHARVVARLALHLFDEAWTLHGLGPREREWLEHAVRLHDVGARISPDRFHRHGAYLVEHGGLRGFSPEEVAAISSVIRFQRGRPPRRSYVPFAGLSPASQRAVRLLTGIFRVAHALGRGGEAEALQVEVRVSGRAVRIGVAGTGDPGAAVAEASQEAELLARALEADVSIRVDLPEHEGCPARSGRS